MSEQTRTLNRLVVRLEPKLWAFPVLREHYGQDHPRKAGDATYWELNITVNVNGREFGSVQAVPMDDLQSRFEWYFARAKEELLRHLRQE